MRGKKILSVAVSSALMLSMLPAQAVTAPADQLAGQWYEAAMTTAVERGIIGGDESGNLQPARNITRGEMAVMLDRIMDYQAKADNKFGDLAGGVYYTDAILAASAAGILKGDDLGNVKPGAGITRQETAVMLARVMNIEGIDAPSGNFADQSSIAPWAVKAVNAMKAAGYMGAQEVSFRPADAITRAEVATVLGNIFAGYFNEAKTYSADVNGSAVVNAAGATLRNMKISGDLIVAEGLAEGNLYLDGVTVGGRLLVRGGGVNSVYIRGSSQVGNVIISRQDGPVRVVVEGGAKVEVVVVDDGSDAVKLEGTLGSVVIEGTAAVEVAGTVGTVTVDAADASLKVSGTVAKVATTENAAGAVIEAAAGGKITAVEAGGAGTQITGSGKVDSVSAKANDVTVATPGTKVEAAPGTSGVTAGGKPVAGGSTGGGSSTGGGGGYVPPVSNVANVANIGQLRVALTDTSKTTINITADITSESPVEVKREVTIDGNNKTLTVTGLKSATSTVDDALILYNEASKSVISNLTVNAGLGDGKGVWVGTYAIHVYNATDVTLKDVKATGGNGGILVNSSTVTLEGRVDVSGNGFGGIEVAKGTDLTKNSELTVSGTIVNATETKGTPTAWVVNDGNNPQGTIGGNVSFLTAPHGTKSQTLYYLMTNVLSKAQEYDEYDDDYEYTNIATVSVAANGKITLTYLGALEDFSKVITGTANTLATMDLARFLGALHYSGTGVFEVKYGDKVYRWDNELTLKGSKWASGTDTLVSAIVAKLAAEGLDELSAEGVAFELMLNGTPIDFIIKMELPTAAKVLAEAKQYPYPATAPYEYVGSAEIAGNTVDYTASAEKFIDVSPTNPRPATADLARFLGAMYRFDNGESVYKITYNGTDYFWDVKGTSKGSNWKDNTKSNTLVKAIADDMDKCFDDKDGKLVNGVNPSFILNINGEAVTFNISVSSSDTLKG